jgi:hypothetical protein
VTAPGWSAGAGELAGEGDPLVEQPGSRAAADGGARLVQGGGEGVLEVCAPAALARTASRAGPGSPPATDRTTLALQAASPPARSPGRARLIPNLAVSKTVLRMPSALAVHRSVASAVVISSSPSRPRTTRAVAPRPASTAARTGATVRLEQPIRAVPGRAGLVSGAR